MSTTLLLKLLARIFSLDLRLNSFNEWPRVDVYSDNVKSLFLSTLSMSCNILYTWIISALSRLYSNESNPNARSLSLYGRCDILITSFVARLCTFSIATLSFLNTGHHTVDAYSKWGRTNDLNKFKHISLSMQVKVLNISPRFLFAILILEFICLVNVSLLSIMTPRSFYDSIFSMGSSSWSFLMVYVWFMSWFPKCICLHFLKLKNIFHSADQSIELFMAHCNCVTSAMLVTVWYIFASSAKSFLRAWITNGRSFMKIRNRIGPRTLPWGISLVTFAFFICSRRLILIVFVLWESLWSRNR